METIANLLLAGLVILEYIGMVIKQFVQVTQTVVHWTWDTIFGAVIALVGLVVLWVKLSDQSLSPFSAWSTFISILLVVVYLGRLVALIINHDELEEAERPRYKPKRIDDWCEPVSTH